MKEFHEMHAGQTLPAGQTPSAGPEDKNAADMWRALCAWAHWEGRVDAITLKTLARTARVSDRTARKGLKLLLETGLVHMERVRCGGKILYTRFRLLPWWGAAQNL